MQALLLITIFSAVLAVVANIVTVGTRGATQLKEDRIAETSRYFDAIGKVVNNDITPNLLRANGVAATSPADLIRNTSQLAMLSSGRWNDPALDPWGKPVMGKLVYGTQVIYQDGVTSSNVTVPVTGIALVSGGPDLTVQTQLTSATTLSSLQGVMPPAGSDDITYIFTDEAAQRRVLASLQTHVARIAGAALQDYQLRLNAYRRARLAAYQAALASGQSVDLNAMLADDSNAPQFTDLSVAANRVSLGVDDDFRQVERVLPSGGRFTVKSTAVSDTLTITVVNDAAKPTPWSPFTYQIKVKGG